MNSEASYDVSIPINNLYELIRIGFKPVSLVGQVRTQWKCLYKGVTIKNQRGSIITAGHNRQACTRDVTPGAFAGKLFDK